MRFSFQQTWQRMFFITCRLSSVQNFYREHYCWMFNLSWRNWNYFIPMGIIQSYWKEREWRSSWFQDVRWHFYCTLDIELSKRYDPLLKRKSYWYSLCLLWSYGRLGLWSWIRHNKRFLTSLVCSQFWYAFQCFWIHVKRQTWEH